MAMDEDCATVDELYNERMRSWYFSRQEIENNSPSRKDGIDRRKESELRMLYCSFIGDVGRRLKLPQISIATAIMFCHRFYLHQSHAKNEWQTIATVCIFLAAKVEDTPCALDSVVRVAYETMYRRDSTAARRISQKDVFEKQKALILIGERLLLSTVRFDFNVQHPYKPLLDALNKLRITRKDVRQVAWNFVNDWLRSTLCLQYKPHYIAAGSLFLAAKFHNVKLPSGRGYAWWNEFDVNPRQLEAAIREMMELYASKQRSVATPHLEKPIVEAPAVEKQQISSSPDSVLSAPGFSTSSPSHDLNGEEGGSQRDFECSTSNAEVEKGLNQVDVCRIKELMKKRKRQREVYGKAVTSVDCNEEEDAWIEREIEGGIILGAESPRKKRKQL
ncbi:cyclin-T1-2-like [Ananas comosus]|uniref:Cyclin-T1-2-like n=2 Tax=Ananas comosus TaxID=4615 RepID=A0A6P5G3E6_ANACO|nr:cyclin-T1-2-like [Ananas comosus]XP_020100243.1 cyclin-T1-2-like [Ananas comosus]CAD1822715.1 unnamed protein product [Ananas comosus var. bracteatus]